MLVLLKTMLRVILRLPLTNADRFRMQTNEEITESLYSSNDLQKKADGIFLQRCCKKCAVRELRLPDGETIELHECDFVEEGDGCPHGNSLLWWLNQLSEE